MHARQGMLTLHEHLIPLLFCKGVRGFQVFVPFVFVLSFSLFQIYLVSLDYALLISHMGILRWTHDRCCGLNKTLTLLVYMYSCFIKTFVDPRFLFIILRFAIFVFRLSCLCGLCTSLFHFPLFKNFEIFIIHIVEKKVYEKK